MTALPDLFPGFHARTFETDEASIFARLKGSGPPVALLHGYPQTHAMWHRVAPALAEHFTCVVPDLRGYGASSAPAAAPDHSTYSKRAMARDVAAVMRTLGHERFAVVGHDRGGRVGYRLALDDPGRVERLAVLDIVPTQAMWRGLDAKLAMKAYHWLFLAQPAPLPETLIGSHSDFYLERTIASWTRDTSLSAFDPRALQHYRASFRQPERIHAACEDYRAGRTCDLAADEADLAAGRRIACPVLALWGAAGFPSETGGPLEIWRNWAEDVRGVAVESGHFACEENPDATLQALLPFLKGEAA
jgi:haloacetate dehalogenase